MHTYLIRQNCQTMARITADSASSALEYFGLKMDDFCEEVERVITHYDLDFVTYGITYGFSSQHGVVAVREV